MKPTRPSDLQFAELKEVCHTAKVANLPFPAAGRFICAQLAYFAKPQKRVTYTAIAGGQGPGKVINSAGPTSFDIA